MHRYTSFFNLNGRKKTQSVIYAISPFDAAFLAAYEWFYTKGLLNPLPPGGLGLEHKKHEQRNTIRHEKKFEISIHSDRGSYSFRGHAAFIAVFGDVHIFHATEFHHCSRLWPREEIGDREFMRQSWMYSNDAGDYCAMYLRHMDISFITCPVILNLNYRYFNPVDPFHASRRIGQCQS